MKRSRSAVRANLRGDVEIHPECMGYMEFELWTIQEAVKAGHNQADVLNRTMTLALYDWRGLDRIRQELGLTPRYNYHKSEQDPPQNDS